MLRIFSVVVSFFLSLSLALSHPPSASPDLPWKMCSPAVYSNKVQLYRSNILLLSLRDLSPSLWDLSLYLFTYPIRISSSLCSLHSLAVRTALATNITFNLLILVNFAENVINLDTRRFIVTNLYSEFQMIYVMFRWVRIRFSNTPPGIRVCVEYLLLEFHENYYLYERIITAHQLFHTNINNWKWILLCFALLRFTSFHFISHRLNWFYMCCIDRQVSSFSCFFSLFLAILCNAWFISNATMYTSLSVKFFHLNGRTDFIPMILNTAHNFNLTCDIATRVSNSFNFTEYKFRLIVTKTTYKNTLVQSIFLIDSHRYFQTKFARFVN